MRTRCWKYTVFGTDQKQRAHAQELSPDSRQPACWAGVALVFVAQKKKRAFCVLPSRTLLSIHVEHSAESPLCPFLLLFALSGRVCETHVFITLACRTRLAKARVSLSLSLSISHEWGEWIWGEDARLLVRLLSMQLMWIKMQ